MKGMYPTLNTRTMSTFDKTEAFHYGRPVVSPTLNKSLFGSRRHLGVSCVEVNHF